MPNFVMFEAPTGFQWEIIRAETAPQFYNITRTLMQYQSTVINAFNSNISNRSNV